jgi:nucleoside-diphosphate-sugar epimerase
MRITVTGATGNVGSRVIAALADDPQVDEIIGVARRVPDWHPPKTRWVSADVSVDDLAPAIAGSAVVVHLAWLFQPTHDPLATWHTNVIGSERVFGAAVEADVEAIVHASSVGAYSPKESDSAVDESWPTHALPTAAYGREKSYVERMLDALEVEYPDLRVVRLRPAFTFQRQSASEQRRLFAGALLPGRLFAPGRLPFVPDIPGLRFQVVHTDDVAEAYRLAATTQVEGAFNIATEPIVDGGVLASLLGGRRVTTPKVIVRNAVALGWHLRAIPASPELVDLFLDLPTMDTSRARTELGWAPRHDALSTVRELLEGMAVDASGPTPPLGAPPSAPTEEPELASSAPVSG